MIDERHLIKIKEINSSIFGFVSEIQNQILNPLCDKYHMSFSPKEIKYQRNYSWYFYDLDDPDKDVLFMSGDDSGSEYFMSKKDSEQFVILAGLLDTKLGSADIGEILADYSPDIK